MSFKVFSRSDVDKEQIDLQPGDFILTHGTGGLDRLVQFATFSHWNHAALVVDEDGTIIEALARGLSKNNIKEYPPAAFHLVRIDLSQEDRAEVVKYAQAILDRKPKYGFIDIVAIGLKILTRSRFVIKLDGTYICSEFVAKALAQGGVIWYKDTSLITPADLYRRFVEQQTGE